MKSLEEFRRHYETELKPVLREFDCKRQKILRKLMIVGALIISVFGSATAMLASSLSSSTPAMIVGFLGLAGIGLAWRLLTKSFKSEFKNSVIRSIVAFVDPNLAYVPEGCISQAEFTHSTLFKHGIDRYRGEDLVQGSVDKTAIRFSEIHAEYKTTTTNSKGQRQTQWHTIFKGLFFVGDFNKHFSGRTVVLPDSAQKLFGRLGQKLQSMNMNRDDLVKLEDPEFEKAFVVYGSDQTEARYILSTSLMRRLLEFQKKVRVPIHAAFVSSNIYLAVSTRKNMFEPRIFRTLLDFGMLQEYLEDVVFAVGIVEDLNLNTRIWTKE